MSVVASIGICSVWYAVFASRLAPTLNRRTPTPCGSEPAREGAREEITPRQYHPAASNRPL
ncbi:hypothetical protein FQ185_25465 [Pseudomonas sp. ANT_H12B]|nr:hypothetical protein FQ185_25465 [Pseudomonas sp. ANT_H12B]